MTDEPTSTYYYCSACGTDGPQLSSEGTEAADHMQSEHGVDPEAGPQADSPYLIPVDSNPTGS